MSNIQVAQRDYDRVLAALYERLAYGEIREGDRLPSVRQLATILDAQRETVRRALWELVEDGYLEMKQGSGTFVRTLPARDEVKVKKIMVWMPYVPGGMMYTPSLFREFENRPDRPYHFEIFTSIEALKLQRIGDYSGMIAVTPTHETLDEIVKVLDSRIPLVSLSRTFSGMRAMAVLEDNYDSAYELTSWLMSKGHRKIAFIGDSTQKKNAFVLARLHGWQAALEEMDINPAEQEICWFDSTDSAQLFKKMAESFSNIQCDAFFFSMGIFLEEALRLIAVRNLDFIDRHAIACIDTNGGNPNIAYAIHDTPKMIQLALDMLSEWPVKNDARNANVKMKIHLPS